VFVSTPLYFITTCTRDRRPFLANEQAQSILRGEWESALQRHGWAIGRFLVMPDHVHFFCAPKPDVESKTLSQFMGLWKEWTAKRMIREIGIESPVWQKQFFDRLLRTRESYAEKWFYVRENPVHAGLVSRAEEWPWQGFVDFDEP
jgi:REP element-mobilizing transposase RayT